MRNIWFPKAAAEYMTRKRFEELGLTEAAIGVRDRTFGSQAMLEEIARAKQERAAQSAFAVEIAVRKRRIHNGVHRRRRLLG